MCESKQARKKESKQARKQESKPVLTNKQVLTNQSYYDNEPVLTNKQAIKKESEKGGAKVKTE